MIILASTSPQRQKILKELGINFKVVAPNFDEDVQDKSLPPIKYCEFLALSKAKEVASRYPNDVVIGADTIVIYNDHIFEKPSDEKDSLRILMGLSGTTHQVVTAVCVIKDKKVTLYHEVANVTFTNFSEDEAKEYIKTHEGENKAGAYAIQGQAGGFVEKYTGELYTIVGMPTERLIKVLNDYGVSGLGNCKIVRKDGFIEAVMFVFYKDGEVLFEDRGRGFENVCFIPSGAIEYQDKKPGGNYIENALFREVGEEFQKRINIKTKQYLGEIVVPEIQVIFFVYLITDWSGSFPSHIVEDGEPDSKVSFIKISEAKKLVKFQNLLEVLNLVSNALNE